MKNLLTIAIFMVTPNMLSATEVSRELNDLEDTAQDTEGNIYRTVTIGEQVWLAENLRSTLFQDGSKVNTGFIPDDEQKNLLKYGRLYDWHDVSNEKNICPVGWRVSSDDDWKRLERSIGVAEGELDKEGWRGDNDVAITLKESQPSSLCKTFDQEKVNQHKFFARPAGVKLNNCYITQGMYAEFWTSTNASNKEAYARTLAYSWWNTHKSEIRRAALTKTHMFSVRCVKKQV